MNISAITKNLVDYVGYPIVYNRNPIFAIKHALLSALSLCAAKGLLSKKKLHTIASACAAPHTFRTPFGTFEADTWDAWMRFHPTYEAAIRTIILDKKEQHHQSGNNVVINIGANVGRWTIELAKMGYTVLAFEPIPRVFEKLQKNIGLSGLEDKVSASNVALGDENKQEVMHVFRFHEGASYLNDALDSYSLDQAETFTVPVVAFDSIDHISQSSKEKASIVLIDVEGYELSVLKGMDQFIASTGSIDFFLEIHPTSRTRQATIQFMIDRGFDGKEIDDKNNWHFYK